MGVSLKKGESVNLTKVATDAGKTLSKLVAGAGWDAATEGAKIDLDLLAVYLDENGKAIPDANGNGSNADEALVFFNNLKVAGAEHSGDNLTGDGDGDDETITFDLAAIPANVKAVAVVIASYSGQTFGEVKSAFVRLVNTDGNEEMAKYELGADHASTKAVELGRISRTADGWDFKASGTDVAGEFDAVVKSYGVDA